MTAPSAALGQPVTVPWAPTPNTLTSHAGTDAPGPHTSAFAVVVDAAGDVLAVRVAARGWDLPGGHLDDGETAEDAVRREVAEEAGIRLEAPLELVGWLHLHLAGPAPAGYRYPHPDTYMPMYLARLGHCPTPTSMVPDEVLEVEFCAPQTLLDRCPDAVWRPLLEQALGR